MHSKKRTKPSYSYTVGFSVSTILQLVYSPLPIKAAEAKGSYTPRSRAKHDCYDEISRSDATADSV